MLHEGLIGLVLTGLMILLFLGSMRATGAVLLSIPHFRAGDFVVLYMLGSTINTMILGGLALAFLARDRQLRDLARKHLPASGNGIVAGASRRSRAARK